MRKLTVWVVLAVCGIAQAQIGLDPFAMSRNMMTSTGNLMSQGDIKKELQLSGAQNEKISDIAKAHQKEMQEIAKKAQSPGADMSSMTAAMKEMETLDSETHAAIVKELTPDQARRLTQLKWQIIGVKSIYDVALQKEIGLSEEQVGKLDDWRKGESSRMMALVSASRSPNAMKEPRKKMRADDEAAILGVLLPGQVEKYKSAIGPESKAAKRMAELVH